MAIIAGSTNIIKIMYELQSVVYSKTFKQEKKNVWKFPSLHHIRYLMSIRTKSRNRSVFKLAGWFFCGNSSQEQQKGKPFLSQDYMQIVLLFGILIRSIEIKKCSNSRIITRGEVRTVWNSCGSQRFIYPYYSVTYILSKRTLALLWLIKWWEYFVYALGSTLRVGPPFGDMKPLISDEEWEGP